jgi:hypothetical protein
MPVFDVPATLSLLKESSHSSKYDAGLAPKADLIAQAKKTLTLP